MLDAYTHMYTYIYTCTHKCIYIYICIYNICIYTCMQYFMHMHTYIDIHLFIHRPENHQDDADIYIYIYSIYMIPRNSGPSYWYLLAWPRRYTVRERYRRFCAAPLRSSWVATVWGPLACPQSGFLDNTPVYVYEQNTYICICACMYICVLYMF